MWVSNLYIAEFWKFLIYIKMVTYWMWSSGICIFMQLYVSKIYLLVCIYVDFPGGASGKEPASQCRRCKRYRFDPKVGKMPWRRAWQSTPVVLPGESHEQRRLAGYSPWGCKELNWLKRLCTHACTRIYVCVCAQSCLALYGPMDCSLPGFCIRGILQEKYLNGLPFPIPGDLPDPGMEPIPLLFPE